ncbi:MAG: 5-formyltetrahydrofolate cyclo-ligase [Sphingobacterium composti]
MTKSELRKIFREKRNRLSIEELRLLNENLLEQFKTIDWANYSYVHVYLPLAKFNEPDTSNLINWLSQYYPNLKLVISKSNFDTGELLHYELKAETKLVENNYGILEPMNGVLVDEKLLDVVLVPLLVVDCFGNRIGYGKGFYDRFLLKCRKDVKSYGVSFFEPVELISDVGEWDVRLTNLITPERLYSFNKKQP